MRSETVIAFHIGSPAHFLEGNASGSAQQGARAQAGLYVAMIVPVVVTS
jgi:hypothetical protein